MSGDGTCHNNHPHLLQVYSNDTNNLSISLNSFMNEYVQKRFVRKNITYCSSIFLTPMKHWYYSSSYYCVAERQNLNTGFKQSCKMSEKVAELISLPSKASPSFLVLECLL